MVLACACYSLPLTRNPKRTKPKEFMSESWLRISHRSVTKSTCVFHGNLRGPMAAGSRGFASTQLGADHLYANFSAYWVRPAPSTLRGSTKGDFSRGSQP